MSPIVELFKIQFRSIFIKGTSVKIRSLLLTVGVGITNLSQELYILNGSLDSGSSFTQKVLVKK